jgi:hypothetical protein
MARSIEPILAREKRRPLSGVRRPLHCDRPNHNLVRIVAVIGWAVVALRAAPLTPHQKRRRSPARMARTCSGRGAEHGGAACDAMNAGLPPEHSRGDSHDPFERLRERELAPVADVAGDHGERSIRLDEL